MRSIKILPPNLVNKIAAGEVIQRPAAAVKELIENSIDAGAKNINIIIQDAGKKLIHIVDDGSGMNTEDAKIAFERHATSKITSEEDLENIRTLGFRGEALAAIAAISHMEMRTKHQEANIGTKVRVVGGTVIDITEDAAPAGTSIQVKNLFYNTPARRNFLKSNPTEFRHIHDVVQRFAVSYPDIAIKFISEGDNIYNLKKSEKRDRLKDIFGEKFVQALIYFECESESVKLSGFLGKPEFSRKTRSEQYLFLNGRFIVNRSINHAVFQAYEHLIEKGGFPFFIIFLFIDPREIDVNVHPTKIEVKFSNEQLLYKLVISEIRKVLSAHDLTPGADIKTESSPGSKMGFTLRSAKSGERVKNWEELVKNYGTGEAEKINLKQTYPTDETLLGKIEDIFTGIQSSASKTGSDAAKSVQIPLWQAHRKYIILQNETGLMIIDQHAAHERILYERAIARIDRLQKQSQQLLFPHTIEMSAAYAALVMQLQSLLESLGFSFKMFGKSTIILEGVPVDVMPGKEGTILQDVIDYYKEDKLDLKLEPRDKLAKSYACKAAIKAGDALMETEMRSLLDQLFQTKMPYSCPHGRPVMITLTLDELDKRFRRTG